MQNKAKIILNKFILFLWDDRFKFESDLEVSRKLMMLNYVVIACAIFLVPFGIFSFIDENYLVGSLDIFAALLISIATYYYKKTKNYTFLTYVLVLVLGTLFLFLLFTAGVDYSGPLWSYIFPLSVMFMLGRKVGRYFCISYLLIVIIFFVANLTTVSYTLQFKLRFIGSFIAASVISYYIEFIREVMQNLLREKNSDLRSSLQKLEQQEKSLSDKELYYRTLFESLNDAIFLMENNVFAECNAKTLEMFDCEKEDIINKSPIKFSPEFQPDGQPSSTKALEKIKAALDGKTQSFEWVHCKLNGNEFFAEVNLNLIQFDTKKLIQASVRDITKRKLAEEKLRLAKELAEKSDR